MNTAVINLKVHPETKKKAQEVAEALGFSLSSLINAYLKQLVKTREVSFSDIREVPSKYMLESLKRADEDIKAGRVTSFANGKDALKYLDDMIDRDERHKKD